VSLDTRYVRIRLSAPSSWRSMDEKGSLSALKIEYLTTGRQKWRPSYKDVRRRKNSGAAGVQAISDVTPVLVPATLSI
jgi:hypothetical protein